MDGRLVLIENFDTPVGNTADLLDRYGEEPYNLFEIAKKARAALKKAEKELEKARKTKKHIEFHQWNIEDYATKIGEIREKIREFEEKIRVEKVCLAAFQRIARDLGQDIEDTWFRRFIIWHNRIGAYFDWPPVFELVRMNSVWFFDVLLAILVFYVYLTF
ncbi:hypothetical protein CRE_22545 [Caenorhabditis remanei]|uniref:Uncharacterized protein n=1 Tax=Caenorhabditis remanei TaxID=31234 RepID=E3MU29_CAERE|nr:hypothetical protein CRE_22545 [Caenorhabditis remanei]